MYTFQNLDAAAAIAGRLLTIPNVPAGAVRAILARKAKNGQPRRLIGAFELPAITPTFRTITNATTDFAVGEVGIYTLNGVEGFYRYKGPPYALPTGPDSTTWRQVAPPLAPGATYLTIAVDVAQNLLQDDTILAIRYNIVRGDGSTVELFGVPAGNGLHSSFSPQGWWFNNSTGLRQWADYDVATDEVSGFYPFKVDHNLRYLVQASTYANGELQGSQPDGSLPGMRFSDATHGYCFEEGNAGPSMFVWCRYPKG